MHTTRHAILFVIDGLRPDALERTHTPEIDRLVREGSYTCHAQTTEPSITLPCHVSMFFGVPPARHGVVDNVWRPPSPPVKSLLDIAHEAGLSTAAFYTWEQLRDLASPGALDIAYYRRLDKLEGNRELETALAACEYIVREDPSLTFVYLGATDEIGHAYGWMSEPYLQAVSRADGIVGLILRASRLSGTGDDTVYLVTSDHGGHEFGHSGGEAEDLTIPWILSGAGVRQGHRMATGVSIVDTAPTLAHLLGLPRPPQWSGRVVAEALT